MSDTKNIETVEDVENETPREKLFLVSWSINEEATTAREAVERIWRDVFGRDQTMPDDACVFDVTHPDGHVETIDLLDD